jgi:heme/copper-type cytochrome/quinol oxidase subunit 2
MTTVTNNSIYTPWQLTFNNPATPVLDGIIELHNYVLMYLILFFIVIIWFLIRCLYLFYVSSKNEALDSTNDPLVEATWVVAPAFIFIIIAMPSFSLLYSMDEVMDPSLVVKATPHEWYWSFEFEAYQSNYSQRYVDICFEKNECSGNLTDFYALAEIVRKVFSQFKFIFTTIVVEPFIKVNQSSYLYKVFRGLAVLIFDELALLKNTSLSGWNSSVSEVVKYLNCFEKAKKVFINAPVKSFIKSEEEFIYNNGAQKMVITSFKIKSSILKAGAAYFQIQSKKDIAPYMQHLYAIQKVFPKFNNDKCEVLCPVHLTGNNQKGFDFMALQRNFDLYGNVNFNLGLGEFNSKIIGILDPNRAHGLSKESQISAALSSFKTFGETVELGCRPVIDVERLSKSMNRLFVGNPFLQDYFIKKGPEATLRIILELNQYHKTDPLLVKAKIYASVMTRDVLSETVKADRLKQNIDFYGHFEVVEEDESIRVENSKTSLIKNGNGG